MSSTLGSALSLRFRPLPIPLRTGRRLPKLPACSDFQPPPCVVGSNVGCGDEDDASVEGCRVQCVRHLLHLGKLKDTLPAGDLTRMTVTNGPIIRVDIGISDDGNGSDNEKKMKGRRGFVSTIAASSFICSMGLIPYWNFCCSNTPLSISGTWMDVFPTVDIILIISSLILTGLASHFKEGELPDNLGFKILQIVQLLVLLCLWAASFIPLHVCRGISNWVVWPFASAAFCIIVLPWVALFQQTEVVIKRIKSVFKKVPQWLRNLSLPECIKAKFKKVLRKQTDPIPSIEMV